MDNDIFGRLWNDEIDDFLLDNDFEWSCGSVHKSSIDTDLSTLSLLHDDFLCSVWMHAAVIKNLSAEEQIEALDELHHLGMVHHRHVEQTIVWHSTGGKAISLGISHTYGHHFPVDYLGVDA